MLALSTLVAIFFYLTAATLQFMALKKQPRTSTRVIRHLAAIAIAAHTLSVYSVLHRPEGINLGFFIAGSLVAWLVALVVVISSLRQRVENLFIAVLPMAALTALLSVWGPDLGVARLYDGGLIIHILLSILAYSIFTLATFQAFLFSMQEQALKQHQTRGIITSLPPSKQWSVYCLS